MARLNVKTRVDHGQTHEGASAAAMSAEQALRRSIMSCMLWESEFYEDGEEIASRIIRLASALPPERVAWIAVEAREQGNLRHVPLLLLSIIARTGKGQKGVADTISRVIQRADELSEFLAIHAKVNKVAPNAIKATLSSQMKKGIARAFLKFDEYQLAKYDRDGAVRLRDALFLSHAKPENKKQAALWKRLADGKLMIPDTWEVALSGGADKKETFEHLLSDGKLGYLALLRNLRNMSEAGCNPDLVRNAILARKGAQRVLPFRYVAAARAAPHYEPAIDVALNAAIGEANSLPGWTGIFVDVSGSMDAKLSGKSDLNRMDAAAALASVIPGNVRVFSFSNQTVEVAPRRGMAGIDAIQRSQPHGGTELGQAVQHANLLAGTNQLGPKLDRFIFISDEQSRDHVPDPVVKHAYMINVASYSHGVGYKRWTHIDGFSESVLKFMAAHEGLLPANGQSTDAAAA